MLKLSNAILFRSNNLLVFQRIFQHEHAEFSTIAGDHRNDAAAQRVAHVGGQQHWVFGRFAGLQQGGGDGHHILEWHLFLQQLASGPRRLLAVFNELAVLAFCVLFLVSCWWFMQRAARFSTPALSIPNLWYYMPAIAGMVLTTEALAHHALGGIRYFIWDQRKMMDPAGRELLVRLQIGGSVLLTLGAWALWVWR